MSFRPNLLRQQVKIIQLKRYIYTAAACPFTGITNLPSSLDNTLRLKTPSPATLLAKLLTDCGVFTNNVPHYQKLREATTPLQLIRSASQHRKSRFFKPLKDNNDTGVELVEVRVNNSEEDTNKDTFIATPLPEPSV
jgi:hypothetical protein